jgi:2-amino-4-hydroxy-6-hydroxymethyldihydropteridine diphosphokinase
MNVDEAPSAVDRAAGAALTGYLGLGSNMGDRRAHLQAAVASLRSRGIGVTASSAVYETDPVGEVLDQRAFLNAAIAVSVGVEPEDLLVAAKEIELELGRDPDTPRHGPRPVDIDLLLMEGRVLDGPDLHLPHRDLLQRRFVLVPLLELDFALLHSDGRSLSEALARLAPDEQRVRWAGPPLTV